MTRNRWSLLALAALLAFTVAVTTAWHSSSAGSAKELTDGFASLPVGSIQRADIITRVTKMTAIAKTISRIDAKATTWGQYLQSQSSGDVYFHPTTPPETPVWAVAVAGEFLPSHSKGSEIYRWGVIVFDSTNGTWLRTDASYQSDWPTFFDRLP